MPIESTDAIENLQRILSQMPPAVLAIVFLAGPTVGWLLYRYVVQPRTRRFAGDGSDLLWICERCRSANEVRSSRCYRCAMERDETVGALQVVDGDGIVTLEREDDGDPAYPISQPVIAAATDRPPVAVGPGRGRPEPAAAVPVEPGAKRRRPSVAVGPGKEASAVPARPRKVGAAGPTDAVPRGTRKRD